MARSVTGYRRDLEKQLSRLTRNGEAYDQGHEDAALDLAVAIRVLVRDTPRSASVLGPRGLGVLEDTQFMDTRLPPPPSLPGTQVLGAPAFSLLQVELIVGPTVGTGLAFRPALGSRNHRWVDFDRWLKEPIARGTRVTKPHSRWDFVDAIVHSEGGAHVDPTISDLYRAIAVEMGYGAAIDAATGEAAPFDNDPTYAVIRQVAYEVEHTILERLSRYLAGPDRV